MPTPSLEFPCRQGHIVKAKTASYTITASENGVLFTNRGAGSAITFTLPDTSTGAIPVGFEVQFYGVSATGFTVASNPTDTIVTLNDAGADSITMTSTSKIIGAALRLIWDGTAWLAFQASVGNTYTVAT